jgi:MarR family transcriptional regulator, lower aerobic nicotinate degradation pathway regulator
MQRTSTRVAKTARRFEVMYRLEDQVGFLLRRAYQRASSNLIERIGQYDLTAPQFATLARLHERGMLSQNLLGRLVAMEPANIRDVVQRLKKRRLVSTRRDTDDARLILVSLTSSGASLVRYLLPIEVECTARTLAALSANEKKLLYDLLGRLAEPA